MRRQTSDVRRDPDSYRDVEACCTAQSFFFALICAICGVGKIIKLFGMNFLKHIIKKYFQIFWMREKFSPATQILQRQLFHYYQLHHKESDKINLKTAGYSVFSQFEEDGKILFILAVIGIHNGSFIEIGSDDGLNSNCANLALNFGWHGLFIDGNNQSIERGRYFYAHYPS